MHPTVLDTFQSVARNSSAGDNPVLQCGIEYWTYGELDTISTGLALQIHEKYGLRPTVAVISENHPYVFAMLLATWKLGGIFVPLDFHAPLEMVKKMLENTDPTCVVLPASDTELIQAINVPAVTFAKDTTLTELSQRFLDLDAELPTDRFPAPTPSSLAIYFHTSSASSIHNLKCVPLTHLVLANGSHASLRLMQKAWPSSSFDKLKILSHSPWTHVMAVSHDIGAAFASAGCIIMGVLPSGYPIDSNDSYNSKNSARIFGKGEHHELDILDRLLLTALQSRPDLVIGVPWVLEGLKLRHERLQSLKMDAEAMLVKEVLQNVKCFGIGGAAMTEELLLWIKEVGINVSCNIGMTELGGPLFQTRITGRLDPRPEKGWPMEDCAIEDAELTLINDSGSEDAHEGELCITSKLISCGYLNYDNSAFIFHPDGTTTFKTGDIYVRSESGLYSWKGRREDYIQLISGETLDPRPIESTLNSCSSVSRSCVVGNNFMKGPSDVVCIIIQPSSTGKLDSKEMAEITRTIASINKILLPPLRVAWSRVGILDAGQEIPYTKKGMVFRKKLETVFGDFLSRLLMMDYDRLPRTKHADAPGVSSIQTNIDSADTVSPSHRAIKSDSSISLSPQSVETTIRWTSNGVKSLVMETIASVLGVDREFLRVNPNVAFAEMGMDSNMAVRIVNQLNGNFGLQFPLNACHELVDIVQLSEAILIELGVLEGPNVSRSDLAEHTSSNPPMQDEVAIVGQALRLPGDINTPGSFWDALMAKRNDIMIPIPADRWDHSSFYRPQDSSDPPRKCDIVFEKAGFVNVTDYDNNFFGISTPEAIYVSPSARLTLETVYEALENAGIPASKLKGSKMGVFVAANLDEGYTMILFQDKGFDSYSRYYGTGVATSAIAGRISYLLDVHGPSSVVDTACSSGLVAIDQAVKYIQSGKGESAVVTAVNTRLWPGSFGFLSAQKMASPNSRCATFTNEADGYVPSEASVSFILKSKSAAIRDGDTILAIIKSTDVMHGGKTQGLVAPSVSTQIALQKSLLRQAHLHPSEIDFIETHGTGTTLGDLIEIQGINEVFQHSHDSNPLLLGAAKTCIGHTEVAAGLVGLLKAIGTVQTGGVPGLVHLTPENLSPSIDCSIVPIAIPTEAASIPSKAKDAYRGLVLSNGFAGTMAGAIVEKPVASMNHIPAPIDAGEIEDILMPFVVSAKTARGLEDYLKNYLSFCRNANPTDFKNICYTSCVSREHYRYRFSCAVGDMHELITCLEDQIRSFSHQKFSRINANRIVFAFPGQGSQYQGMASRLAELYPTFKKTIISHGTTAATLSGLPILSFLLDIQPHSYPAVDDGQVSQICIFVYQYSISLWLRSLGVEPCAVIGHSLGEVSAAVLAGAMTYETGLELVVKRAYLFSLPTTSPGGMAIIEASEEAILQLIHRLGFSGRVVIAVYNDPQSHVVSGELACVDTLLAQSKLHGFRGTKLNVTQAFHSPLIVPQLPALQDWVDEHQSYFSRLKIPIYSTVHGCKITQNSLLRLSHWVDHARDPVRLADATQAIASDKQEIDVVLDIGPQPFMWTALQNTPLDAFTFALTAKSTKHQHKAFLRALLSLFEHGSTIKFDNLFIGSSLQGNRTSLPTYPFQRQRHYPNSIASRHGNSSKVDSEQISSTSRRLVQFQVDQSLYDMLLDHQIEGLRVAPGASLVDFFATRAESRSVKTITFHSPLVISSPHLQISGEIDTNGRFFIAGDSATNQVCSGTLSSKATFPLRDSTSDQPPEYSKSQDEVYGSYRAVHFGPLFRNIQNIRIWKTHADILVTVKPTHFPVHDRIRKIDCCLHAFGAVIERQVPQGLLEQGSFLPASLNDFTLHSEDLPESFICRYHLPCDVQRNYHVMSIAFDVLSLAGSLLISCRRYSVAWIPSGVVVQEKDRRHLLPQSPERPWLLQDWVSQPLSGGDLASYDHLLYVSFQHEDTQIGRILKELANEMTFFRLPVQHANVEHTLQRLKDRSVLVAFDVISTTASPVSEETTRVCEMILDCMKAISMQRRRINASNFIIISEMSLPVLTNASFSSPVTRIPPLPSIGALIQGMFRVFRSETALDSQLWALDLPPVHSLDDTILGNILRDELADRRFNRGNLFRADRSVAYRPGKTGVERFVPILRRTGVGPQVSTVNVTGGVSLVVGMGSIGSALAIALASNGSSRIIFIGRRAIEDQEVLKTIRRLSIETSGKITYVQADVCDLKSLRKCFVEIQSQYGLITNIIHTAAIISDATIPNVEIESFGRVLRPKVAGAWNLHLVSEELCPSLKSFTLLSSISVSLGNQGQIAYVAGNHFMEVLAAHRLANNLPATALQLGPWESKLTENLQTSNTLVHMMKNKIGIPLILEAMFRREAVQIIADLNTEGLVEVSAYAQDSLYREILPTAPTEEKAVRAIHTKEDVTEIVIRLLRDVLELRSSEPLGLPRILEISDSLISCGIDSIAFAQIRGKVVNTLSVEVPMMFLSDSFTIDEMISHIVVALGSKVE